MLLVHVLALISESTCTSGISNNYVIETVFLPDDYDIAEFMFELH